MDGRTASRLGVAGTDLWVVVTRKHVKNVNARLRGTTLLVSAPLRMSPGELDRAITDLARRLLRRARARTLNGDGDLLERARRVAARFPSPPPVREVQLSTRQHSRWGSCNGATGSITLNAALAHMPAWVLEAVIAHELAHLFHRDHGPAFRALLARVCPEHERARDFLAGVGWLAGRWHAIPEGERTQLGALADDSGA